MTEFIQFEELSGQNGSIGLITLNRQQALNALNHEMFIALHDRLIEWRSASMIKAVIIRSAPGRAFSAGGDIRSAYEKKQNNDPKLKDFFLDEYKLDKLIFHYSKPYIALLDGITMGGGAGISINGSHRVATEQLIFAMPETSIGFYPDVGASYFLSRLPHHIGLYLGLTGEKISYADCYALGLVDVVIDRKKQDALVTDLVNHSLSDTDAVTHILSQYKIAVRSSALLEHQTEISYCFAKKTVVDIIDALEKYGTEWCAKTADLLKKKSPLSLQVTLLALQRGKALTFDACIEMESRITQQMIKGDDFFEGIRALLIDKDQKPCWQAQTLSDVTEDKLHPYFEA